MEKNSNKTGLTSSPHAYIICSSFLKKGNHYVGVKENSAKARRTQKSEQQGDALSSSREFYTNDRR